MLDMFNKDTDLKFDFLSLRITITPQRILQYCIFITSFKNKNELTLLEMFVQDEHKC